MRHQVAALSAIAVVFGFALAALAQDKQARDPDAALATSATLAGFNITVARTSKGVALTCEKGCAWKTLTFSLRSRPTPVNPNGMAGNKNNPEKAGLFLLRFGAEADGFQLTCDRGCAWRKLGWSYPSDGKPVAINEYGTAQHK